MLRCAVLTLVASLLPDLLLRILLLCCPAYECVAPLKLAPCLLHRFVSGVPHDPPPCAVWCVMQKNTSMKRASTTMHGRSDQELMMLDPKNVKRILANRQVLYHNLMFVQN